ncbi:MAG: hypothetical protein IKW51_04430 [Bacteroidales bacterium]|nr:hypothetical protein [Bacteroidales bacterium]
MKMKERHSRLKSNWNKDWTYTLCLIIVLLLSFFVPEQKNMFTKWFMNIVYFSAGIGAFIYIYYAIRYLFNMIELDLLWIKNKFLHKVVNLVMLVPFAIMVLFVFCDGVIPNMWKEYIAKEKYSAISECQKNFAKELVFAENMYDKDTISMEDEYALLYNSNKYIAKLTGWEFDDSLRCFVKEIDKLPKNIVNEASEEPSLFWSVYYHYIDPGNQHIAPTENGRRWAAVIAILGYLLLNGLLVAVLIGWFDRRRENWENGMVRYDSFFKRKGHYVIIGGNDMVIGIVKHLFDKKDKDKDKYKVSSYTYIIVQTTRDVESFRRKLFSELTEKQQEYVIFYYGNRTSKTDIEDLKLNTAKEIYVVGESIADDGQNHDAFNMDCLRLITSNLQIPPDKKEGKNVYVIFENQITFSSFQFSDISADDKNKINYMPLNYYEMWAQKTFAFPDPEYYINDKDDIYLPLDTIREIDKTTKEEKFSYISRNDKHYVHLVIMGMTKMGVAMAIEAAHVAHYPNALTSNGPRTRITFIDENADRESGYFMNRYNDMFALTRWRYAEADKYNQRIKTEAGKDLYVDFSPEDTTWHDPLSSDNSTSPYKGMKLGVDGENEGDEFFIDLEWEFIKGDMSSFAVQQYLRECSDREKHPNKILTVAVCLDEPHQAIAAGLYMPDVVYENALQILVYQRFSDGIFKYIAESVSAKENMRYRNVKSFGMLHETFSSVFADDYLPKIVNYIYNYTDYENEKNKKVYDKTEDVFNSVVIKEVSDEQIEECWNETISKFQKGKSGCACRWSSIYNANTIRTKLRSIEWDKKTQLDRYNKNIIITMAMTEHNRWNVEQLLMHYSPLRKNELVKFEKGLCRFSCSDKECRFSHKNNKDNLKKQMRHVDICSYNRLRYVDPGVDIYDVSLSRSLPCIVNRYKKYIECKK